MLLNKGFDHFQATNVRRDIWTFPYDRAFRNGVFDAMTHPGRAIAFYPGWDRWLRTEVLPLTFTHQDARWFVNYTEHLIAGGLTYRMLGEWFFVRDVPLPRVWAALVTFAASMTNEAIEHPATRKRRKRLAGELRDPLLAERVIAARPMDLTQQPLAAVEFQQVLFEEPNGVQAGGIEAAAAVEPFTHEDRFLGRNVPLQDKLAKGLVDELANLQGKLVVRHEGL